MKRSLIACLLMLCGCSGPVRIDATDDETAKRSILAIQRGMSEARKGEFRKDFLKLTFGPTLKSAMGGKKVTGSDLMRPIHGLTADEIHEKAK